MSPKLPYFLGCTAWSCRDWIGPVFRPQTPASALLREYSRLFNTVEANSLFYALPPPATLERWMAESDDAFRFAPKFPKAISHERRLSQASEETKAFLRILDTLAHGNRLGVSFLQLPPSFNINNLDTLETYLKSLPNAFRYAVEPRHVSWYDQAENEKRIDELLASLAIDKVIFDSRPLFSKEPADDDERDAMERKPQTPVRKVALSEHPTLRLVAGNDLAQNDLWVKEWAPVVNKWILEGKTPFVFAHTANDAYAPNLARRFHRQLRKVNPLLPDLPEFASDRDRPARESEQLDLFAPES